MTVKIKYDRNGNVKRVVGNVGRTRMSRAALVLWKGRIEPTAGYKLRRFFKRLYWWFNAKIEEAAFIAMTPEKHAADLPYIGLEEHNA
jgi:hypothetical protein